MTKKHDFKAVNPALNPAMAFISTPEQDAETDKPAAQTEPVKKTVQASPELKNRRLHLLVTPTMAQMLKDAAVREHTSVNDIANKAFSTYLKRLERREGR